MKTRITLVVFLGAFVALLATYVSAGWETGRPGVLPPAHLRAPGTPTKLTGGGAGEVHHAFSGKHVCARFSCGVAVDYTFSTGAPDAGVASGAGNQLPANTIETRCLDGYNYVSIYLSAAGSCWVSELESL